ncbi:methylated-DNA--[protein]-cysteine S-methyltransferase [Sphingobium yanoikuyae]|uniref:Methylated-DNA--protein-cysteine methyltransferase n=1 Tax=Sphingobium yanoikuyae TaxID=13690 RepID=A0AA42WYC1_SPHYA|nr:methylated-DNA--[protein]-cysteine S-methyltransferase [Sphingobium yanoikuyae]MDH2132407.1 methylated-DNA--[protein]-cysteine S-methyltransferase [Sphingobium yanoikuyae]MDH2152086.1 methylated-DNA--[protein]-cysteine S-methyltransferase [Sphingobium yanoikuyae]MDH2167849.1 methylated-DNA--[protein]-cysteine S-methyltransferase [Sphingobium yanoikuyae]
MTLACMTMPSPVGDLTLVASDEGLMAVLWPDDDPARVRLGARSEATDHPVLRDTASQLSEYFAGQRQHFSVPLHFQGTDFQRQVWAALLDIPFGETRSYADIARAIGRPTATRAVGAANGRNPISIIAPCHRVVGSNGALTGFAGGVETKKYLLDLEKGGDDLFSFAPMPLADAGARSV